MHVERVSVRARVCLVREWFYNLSDPEHILVVVGTDIRGRRHRYSQYACTRAFAGRIRLCVQQDPFLLHQHHSLVLLSSTTTTTTTTSSSPSLPLLLVLVFRPILQLLLLLLPLPLLLLHLLSLLWLPYLRLGLPRPV